jgi:hypothetical protein
VLEHTTASVQHHHQRIGDDLILERLYANEQVLLTQTDAFDLKASYFLVVIVFLAQLSTIFLLRPNLSICEKVDQWVACLLLVAAGCFLMSELKVRSFRVEESTGLESWRDKQIQDAYQLPGYKEAQDHNSYLRNRMIWGLIEGSKSRIVNNEIVNATKLSRLVYAYWIAGAAFLLDILFMAYLFRFFVTP